MTEAQQVNFVQSDVGDDVGNGTGVTTSNDYIQWTYPNVTNNSLEEAAKTLKDVIDSRQKRSLFWNIGYILVDFIYAISVDRNMSDDDKKKAVSTALKDFIEQLREIDPITLFNESLKDGEDINPIDKLKNKLEENMEKKEMLEALKSYTPAQLLESAPDLYNKIISASANDKEVQEALKNLPTVTKDRDELLDKNKILTTDNEKLKVDLKESQDKLKVFDDKDEAAEWAGKVDEFIKESGIDNALITETFKGQLIESKDPETVKTLIDARKGLKK